jgi:hypothetical protein
VTPGLTSTGAVLEAMILPALKLGGYEYEIQVLIGDRIGGHKHKVDVRARKGDNNRVLVSLKWQQTSGTAEQKVPFEVICLAEAVKNGNARKAYLVLGGEGWTLRKFYTDGGLASHLTHSEAVEIVTLESFIAKANRGEL